MFLELRLSRIRKQQQVKLNEENRNAFDSIREYISNSSLVLFQREEVLQQILDMMLQAQEEGKDINLFLGHDHKRFCDSIINEYSSGHGFVLKIIGFVEQLVLFIILGILLDTIFWSAPVFKINTILNMVFFLFIFSPMSRKSVKEKIYPTSKKGISSGMAFIIYIVLYVATSQTINAIGKIKGLDLAQLKISVFSIRYALILGILLVIGSEIYKSISNKQRIA